MTINNSTYICIWCKQSIEIGNIDFIFSEEDVHEDEDELLSPDGQRSLTSSLTSKSILECFCKMYKTNKNDSCH